MTSAEKEHKHKMDADIRQPSVPRTEPRTLDELTMECVVAMAQKIYAEDPSQDFTKDAIDMATRENAPAKDATDSISLGRHHEDFIQKADTKSEAPAAPPPTPSAQESGAN